MARAGAVIGRCFVPEVVAGLLDRPIADLDAPIEELVQHAFLHPFNYLDRGYYDFRHQLLRDALYGTVQAGELRRLHARAGEFGAILDGASEVHASLHFERAGLRSQAYRAARAGAEAAGRVSSRRESFELYRRAVRNVPSDTPPAELAQLYIAYADAAALDRRRRGDGVRRLRGAPPVPGGRRSAPRGRDVAARSRTPWPARPRPSTERIALAETLEAELAALPPGDERSLVECDSHLQRAMWALDVPRLDEAERQFTLARAALERLDPEFARTHPDLPAYRQDIDVLARLARRPPGPGRRRARDDDRRRSCGARACASKRPA